MALHQEAIRHSTKGRTRFGWRGLVLAAVLLATGLGIVGGGLTAHQTDRSGHYATHTAGTYQRA